MYLGNLGTKGLIRLFTLKFMGLLLAMSVDKDYTSTSQVSRLNVLTTLCSHLNVSCYFWSS